jgi:serine/threonine-protein kinase HipA
VTALDVWLDGTLVGTFGTQRRISRFTYSPEALALGVGRPLISVSMPTQRGPYAGDVVDAFFDGLLPEGEALKMLAYDFKVSSDDAIGLLERLGGDVAGAVQIVPAGTDPQSPAGSFEPIDDDAVAERLRKLRSFPLGVDDRVRISLAGVQEKLVLTQVESGWALPLDGAPSTHIFKPAHPHLRDAIANEVFCLAVAREADVLTADARVERFGGRPVLVITRFDRTTEGPTRRIHQEDMCQATGTSPRRKYEVDGGPSLRDCASILTKWGSRSDDLRRLLDITTCNIVLGNADAHGKNLSLLHGSEGAIRLAPAYDLFCTRFYEGPETIAGMFVNGVREIDDITADDLVVEAVSWGMSEAAARERIAALLARMPDAITAAAHQTQAPTELVQLVCARLARLGS